MTSLLTDTGAGLPSAEESGPESELSGSNDESAGSVLYTEDLSDDDVQETVVGKKPIVNSCLYWQEKAIELNV